MNVVIIIKDDTITFPTAFGLITGEGGRRMDLEGMLTPYGAYFPVNPLSEICLDYFEGDIIDNKQDPIGTGGLLLSASGVIKRYVGYTAGGYNTIRIPWGKGIVGAYSDSSVYTTRAMMGMHLTKNNVAETLRLMSIIGPTRALDYVVEYPIPKVIELLKERGYVGGPTFPGKGGLKAGEVIQLA